MCGHFISVSLTKRKIFRIGSSKKGFAMLILTRKVGESIVIGGVKVTVVEIKGGRIRLGIEAPKEVNVVRGELINVKN